MYTLVHYPLYTLGLLYVVALVARAVFSFFPIEPRSALDTIYHWLWVITEPYVALFRRVIPPVGAFDISYMIAVLVVWVVSEELFTRIHW